MKKEVKKTLFFLGGALLTGVSLFYFNLQPILALVGILVGGYLIIKALD
tara:strand:+ start:1763 stop:1909 length:147 start_codon:yes stop_codon:yes gene_type:complete